MDVIAEVAVQNYNGGIVFVSYLISVAGAQTTLELLTRRTHIRGYYNWFLLAAAAFTMGAVSIWSMHFIGNNSMTLVLREGSYQLSYQAGYTFGSLVVAIACMFLAFAFVGVSEEAKVSRIIPSGILAGLGIVCMHYMGQFAIDYFVLVYKTGYIIGAAIIAMSAVTVALYIFFKLREKWMNLWYKRLGCAMLMALAVCGMHYTALVGTIFYRPNYSGTPPVPKLQTPALIGIISAIIVSACVGLMYISIKTGMQNLPRYNKNTNKRLILDAVIFDPLGRILVKVDGTLPMTEIVHNLELNETRQEFNTSHPLFMRLFKTSIDQATLKHQNDKRPSGALSINSSIETYDAIERQFLDASRELREELRFTQFSDLGILSDIVVTTDTISKANKFTKRSQLFRNASSSTSSWSSKKQKHNNRSLAEIQITLDPQQQQQHQQSEDEEDDVYNNNQHRSNSNGSSSSKEAKKKKTAHKSRSSWSVAKKSFVDDEETAIESPNGTKRSSGGTIVVLSSSEEIHQDDIKSVNDRLSVEDSDGEDKHIFLVRKLMDESDVSRLMSQGYRFAEPVFISKTMAAKLRIPTDWMRQHFSDMQQLTNSICALTQHDWVPSTVAPAPNPTQFRASSKSSVYVGAFVLIDESNELNNMHIVVDKTKRFAFPMHQLTLENQETPTHLDRKEIDFVLNLQGQSLYDIASLEQTIIAAAYSNKEQDQLPSGHFIRALENAAKKLLESTSYSRALYQTSKLHTTILDLPAFSLTTGPCQLIVFKSFINTLGALAAVNHTFSEPMKCMPLTIYKSLSACITDEAARIYQASTQTQAPPTYLIQQQMYRQQASGSGNYEQKRVHGSNSVEDDIHMNNLFAERLNSSDSSPTTPTAPNMLHDPFSLPPPPRAKRNRFKITNAILNHSPSDVELNLQDQQTKSSSKPLPSLQAAPLSILSTQDRYWWVDPLVEETIHDNIN